MRKNPYYELTDLDQIRRLIRENPWAVLVSNPSTGLAASHYPILLEEDREEFSIVTHVGPWNFIVAHSPEFPRSSSRRRTSRS